eukprot:1358682-Pyramimonas_sp.AAC.1
MRRRLIAAFDRVDQHMGPWQLIWEIHGCAEVELPCHARSWAELPGISTQDARGAVAKFGEQVA